MNIPESVTNGELPGLTLIGDLDGSYDNFRSFAIRSGCMNIAGLWTGGNRIVIFSGDILADRRPDGFRILEAIRHLRRDAQQAGGDIVVLAGNHEEVMIGFLIGDSLNVGADTSPHSVNIGSPFYGLSELMQYGKTREEIVYNMRTDEAGKKSLEDICEMKLMYRKGNSIHFHTPPSKNMLDLLSGLYNTIGDLDGSIDYINQQWKIILRTRLLGEEFSPIENTKIKKIDENTLYILFRNSFLQTANGLPEGFKKRVQESIVPGGLTEDSAQKMLNTMNANAVLTPPTHPMYEILKASSIDTICHGHDSSVGEIDGFDVVGVNRTWKRLSIQQEMKKNTKNILSPFPEFPDKYSVCTVLLGMMKTMPASLSLGKIRLDWSYFPSIHKNNRGNFIQYCNNLLCDEKGAVFHFSDTGETLRFELTLPDDWRESTPINPQNSIQELIQAVRTAKKNL